MIDQPRVFCTGFVERVYNHGDVVGFLPPYRPIRNSLLIRAVPHYMMMTCRRSWQLTRDLLSSQNVQTKER